MATSKIRKCYLVMDISGLRIIIYGWMYEYNLKPIELIAFALVYGFCQDGQTEFSGSITYTMKILNCSRHTAIETMKSLEDKGLIVKKQEEIDGVVYNKYRSVVSK